jgi:hypothetical protein
MVFAGLSFTGNVKARIVLQGLWRQQLAREM